MEAQATLPVWRLRTLGLLAAWLRVLQAQPVCEVAGPFDARCGLSQVPVDGPSWAPAVIFNTAMASVSQGSTSKPPRAERRPPVLELLPRRASQGIVKAGGVSAEALSTKYFRTVWPHRQQTWANTPEGEWTAHVMDAEGAERQAFAEALRSDAGSCMLAGVSVYRPAQEELAFRLNFHNCDREDGVTHAAVVLRVARAAHGEEVGSSALLEWMCALMPARACFPPVPPATTTAAAPPGSLHLNFHANYQVLGPGECFPEDHTLSWRHASVRNANECASECLSENTGALRPGGRFCTSFAYSPTDRRRCLVYAGDGTPSRGGLRQVGDWTCYVLSNAQAGTTIAPPPTPAPTTAAPPSPATVDLARPAKDLWGEAVLNLDAELGLHGFAATRQRLVSLTSPACYRPLEWTTLGPGGAGWEASARPQAAAELGWPSLKLNASAWLLLTSSLPVVVPGNAQVDGTVVADSVCVDLGSSGLCKPPPEVCAVHHDLMRYVLTALVASAFSSAITVCVMTYCNNRVVTYSLVETDCDNPALRQTLTISRPVSKLVGSSSSGCAIS